MKFYDLKVGDRFYVMMEVVFERQNGEIDLSPVAQDDEIDLTDGLEYINEDMFDNMKVKSLTKAQLNKGTKEKIRVVEKEMSALEAKLAELNKQLK